MFTGFTFGTSFCHFSVTVHNIKTIDPIWIGPPTVSYNTSHNKSLSLANEKTQNTNRLNSVTMQK